MFLKIQNLLLMRGPKETMGAWTTGHLRRAENAGSWAPFAMWQLIGRPASPGVKDTSAFPGRRTQTRRPAGSLLPPARSRLSVRLPAEDRRPRRVCARVCGVRASRLLQRKIRACSGGERSSKSVSVMSVLSRILFIFCVHIWIRLLLFLFSVQICLFISFFLSLAHLRRLSFADA
jgi:hypothetical protein